MVKRDKEEFVDPYEDIRRDLYPPGGPLKSKKDYNRMSNRKKIEEEIEEFHDEIDDNIEIY